MRGRGLDKERGFQFEAFADMMTKANGDEGIEKTPGTDRIDPYSLSIKPKNVPVWDKPPVTPEEEAMYYGVHIHSESNPLGLHSHVPGGKLSGGHSHSPSNRTGAHHHKTEKPLYGITVDGAHFHDGKNHPDGGHCHIPENFG